MAQSERKKPPEKSQCKKGVSGELSPEKEKTKRKEKKKREKHEKEKPKLLYSNDGTVFGN